MIWALLIGLVFFAGILVGGAIVTLASERNDLGVMKRSPTTRISTLDVFELPEAMRPPEDEKKG